MKYFILLVLFSASIIKAQTNDIMNNSYWGKYYNHGYRKSINYNYKHANQFSTADSQTALTKVGQWGWGPCFDVAAEGNYAYIGNGYIFQALDMSDPANPKIVGQLPMRYPIEKVAVSGIYAYTIRPFNIINISNPTNPVLVSTYYLPSGDGPTAILVKGNYAYLGDGFGYVFIIDISNPSNPKEIGHLLTYGEFVKSIAVKDTVLYASMGDRDVEIYNIANPSKPFYLPYTVDTSGYAPLTIEGHYLYTGSYSYHQFMMYDLSNPYNPRFVNEIHINSDVGGPINSISVIGTTAYVALYRGKLVMVDIADTNNFHIISEINNKYRFPESTYDAGELLGTTLKYPYVYYATGTGLWTINVNAPHVHMQTVSFFPTGWFINKMTVDSSNHAYLAELYGGLKVLDFSEPSSPKLIGQYLPDEQVIDVAVSGGYAYLDCDSSIQIIDISNLASPKFLSRTAFHDTIPSIIYGNLDYLCLGGSTVYAARKSQRLFTVDVSDAGNPQIKNIYSLRSIPAGISQSNGYLYIAERGVIGLPTGVQIFNLSDPNNPVESGFLKINSLSGLTTYKNNLYVLGYDTTSKKNALEKYDVTDPSHPTLKYLLPNDLRGIISVDIAANNDYAYIAGGGIGGDFLAIDISNPGTGKNVYFGTPDSLGITGFKTVAVSGKIVLTGDLGMTVFENNLITVIMNSTPTPSSFELFQNYPNPFNPSTEISYQLSAVNYVTLKIYDVLGREIETLVNTFQKIGKYVVQFDASKLSSGVYFYRLTAGNYSAVKKMVLLK